MMNRIIKFRAWIEKDDVMLCDGDLPAVFFTWLEDWKESKGPFVVMQYTGLKDKNGVEIYEGDIVEMHTEWVGGYHDDESGEHENKGVVAIVPSKGVMINKCMKRDIIELDQEWKKTWSVNVRGYRSVVIGNIHETPELLK